MDMQRKGNVSENGNARGSDMLCTLAETEECDFSKLMERPRPLNMERKRSLDERSFNELSTALSPHLSLRNAENSFRLTDPFGYSLSPERRSGYNTPRAENGFETHPMVAEAWEALRRSLVYFRGRPVGTIAALDNSGENLNYDQVKSTISGLYDGVPSTSSYLVIITTACICPCWSTEHEVHRT